MQENIVQCSECNARNRLRPADGAGKLPGCGRCQAKLPWLVDAGDGNFEQEAAAPVPVLVDLWAPWCGSCRVVAPELEELSRELARRLKVVKVNVAENPRPASRFDARSIPVLVLMQDGEVRETVVGAQPKAVLRQLVNLYLGVGLSRGVSASAMVIEDRR